MLLSAQVKSGRSGILLTDASVNVMDKQMQLGDPCQVIEELV